MMHLILLLGLLIASYFSSFQAENPFLQYWEEHIGLPHPPHWLAAKASPLSPHQATVFLKLMEENELPFHLPSFCKQANIACSKNALVKKIMDNPMLPPIAQSSAIKVIYDRVPSGSPLSISRQGGLLFFRESMVKQGGFMNITDLRDTMSYNSFLPRSLASKIPFSLARIKELKKLFGVVDDSKMDEYIKDTLEICEKVWTPLLAKKNEKSPIRDEHSTCVTSTEDLIDFVVKKLGHRVSIWSTESIEGSYENVTIGGVKLMYGNLSESPALCHSQPFPSQVYYCHILQRVKVYIVDIYAQKKVNHAIMTCHYDTSTWNPNHIAFKLLGFGPGLIEVCHWINKNGMVWTKTL
ncbi:polygalacturonase non-catalytic subunit AroGP2-like [Macadamia integrifolia]|uniref:polygalacturonase non-catalytic subunit AroGP2-like n=1 Tax=Macadamia integrifolia TaxID=60698 RepID=UPI001C4FC5B5|nr:polygalacturonase non-catalytic subunit AroGP2-like [Macadamia integrifolia]